MKEDRIKCLDLNWSCSKGILRSAVTSYFVNSMCLNYNQSNIAKV